MTIVPALLAGAVLVVLGILSSRLALRLGVPALLLFMGLGMLAGSEGIGGIAFADPEVAQSIGVVALAVILFDGGLSTRWETIKPVVAQGVALATVAVAITAGITGAVAAWVLDVPIEVGLLLGAIVSSTDAAAVFSVLRSRNAGSEGTHPTDARARVRCQRSNGRVLDHRTHRSADRARDRVVVPAPTAGHPVRCRRSPWVWRPGGRPVTSSTTLDSGSKACTRC